jgi:SpoVK/Ycf46/Vps4 family AAA+-type ATPase
MEARVCPNLTRLWQIKEIFEELDALIGIPNVKKSMYAVYDTMLANWELENNAKPASDIFLNHVFVGNSGTGKTTLAKLYARMLCATGMISKEEFIAKSATDFISSAVGASSEKTKSILKLAEGKVLFIDEAYVLFDNTSASTGNKSHGEQVCPCAALHACMRDC